MWSPLASCMQGPEVPARQPLQSLHPCLLQSSVSESVGHVTKPLTTLRVRVRVPPPHVAEHLLQLLQSDTMHKSLSVADHSTGTEYATAGQHA